MLNYKRTDRSLIQMRPVSIKKNVLSYATGSCEISIGNTRVLCAVSVDKHVPSFVPEEEAWLTAEYNMLPCSTHSRIRRDKALNSGRSKEISRLIGRSLRAALDLKKFGQLLITVDCDVIEADGGTRTASITGSFVALCLAVQNLKKQKLIFEEPIARPIAAVSLGILNEQTHLDLNYEEDFNCSTDLNFVCSDNDQIIEIQGTAEKQAFTKSQLQEMTELAQNACQELFQIQKNSLSS